MTTLSIPATDVESHLTQTDDKLTQIGGKSGKALDRLDNLQLERRLMLSLFIDHLSALALMLIVDEVTPPWMHR